MKCLFGICALVFFNGVMAQTMTPVLIEVDAGREVGVFSKSPVIQRAILLKPSIPSDTALLFYRGWSGIANIKSENDWKRNLNYLRNNTELFSQAGIALVVMDCPSDENSVAPGNTPLACNDDYRSSLKHAEDVKKIIAILKEKYGITKFYIMGHSYGTISSKWLAKNLGNEIQGSIHSAAMTRANARNRAYGYSVESFDMSAIKAPVLNVHHGNDQCVSTPYSTVSAYSKNNLVTVKGGEGTGDVCGGTHLHSMGGMEEDTSKAVIKWIKTGQVQSIVGE
ncbi:alpha/beta hydrolase [Polynucleobacter sp. UK-Mo-2m-Kol15]|uniref:alpha/beta hydrolase n=1 Tax=Polynucleobacter sp. UK-Mo-2m-Kol15 TaxID=2576916 RepID=UPI001C0C3429|nr:alpha/beta hydrolase [Polynucleobacter sp. UK-Mo-2m-Kol15]MBU3574430.1 alpha/beta fold hydrolase [Polynucleobacter sp. UK-Mo-2m-Kol15]